MSLFQEHQTLLMRRESRVVVGHSAVNLWLLVIVLTLTLFSIAFAEANIDFLRKKMSNPFTNWVNIDRRSQGDNIAAFADSLVTEGRDTFFGYDDVQTEICADVGLMTKDNKQKHFYTLYYENLGSDLIHAILDPENLETSINPDSIPDTTLGIILTADALRTLGYDPKDAPPTVDISVTCNDNAADSLGFETLPIYEDDMLSFYLVHVPVPLLAVVHRLPLNMQAISSYHFYQYLKDNSEQDAPFHLWAKGSGTRDHEYACQLHYFVDSSITNFEDAVMACASEDVQSVRVAETMLQEQQRCCRSGRVYNLYIRDENEQGSLERAIRVDQAIRTQFADQHVSRVFKYALSTTPISQNLESVLSVHFNRLDSIRAFERFVKSSSDGLQVEMTLVEAKENFAAVSTMANILTVALIVFSIIAIVIFIVNMMQSYFQKVTRNLGTFKAFGMSTKELIRVYVTIIVGIVLAALTISLSFTWCVELILNLLDIKKAGGASHLILWNARTFWAVGIILASTVLSVLVVMRRMLRNTPGDLIYDR